MHLRSVELKTFEPRPAYSDDLLIEGVPCPTESRHAQVEIYGRANGGNGSGICEIVPGWYMGRNISNQEKLEFLVKACRVAETQIGKDLVIHFPQSHDLRCPTTRRSGEHDARSAGDHLSHRGPVNRRLQLHRVLKWQLQDENPGIRSEPKNTIKTITFSQLFSGG
jgi:hypothetical protein